MEQSTIARTTFSFFSFSFFLSFFFTTVWPHIFFCLFETLKHGKYLEIGGNRQEKKGDERRNTSRTSMSSRDPFFCRIQISLVIKLPFFLFRFTLDSDYILTTNANHRSMVQIERLGQATSTPQKAGCLLDQLVFFFFFFSSIHIHQQICSASCYQWLERNSFLLVSSYSELITIAER